MKVPMKWIREYADIPVSAEEYMNRMIMIGDGVEGYEGLGDQVTGVAVGRVLTCEPHPDSDHLHVCTVDVGEPAPLQIVCGAPNVAAGQLVPVATNGAHLPGGVTIKKGKLRGVVSEGMICSGEELGCPPELYPNIWEKGILVFNEDYPLGADVRPILGLDDTVMDFEVLANRPDCLSVWGIARETAVALGTEFKKPEITVTETGKGDVHDYVSVEVRDPDLCPRYVARVIDNVRVGRSGCANTSPAPACARSTTWSTSRTSSCSRPATRCTPSTWTWSRDVRSSSAGRRRASSSPPSTASST